MKTTSRASRRANRLAALHRELATLIRTAREQRQADIFNRATPEIQTQEARTASRTVTLSLREAFDLFRAAMPPTAHDVTSRLNHAMLVISLRLMLDALHAIEHNGRPAAAIAAAELLGRTLRTWTRSAEKPKAKRPSTRPVPAQGRLLLPLVNIRTLTRQKATVSHNAIPLRSQATPDFTSADQEKPLTHAVKTRKAAQ